MTTADRDATRSRRRVDTDRWVVPRAWPLVYVHPARLPAPTANSIQVVAMCEALGRVHTHTWLAAFGRDPELATVAEHYGADATFGLLPVVREPLAGMVSAAAVASVIRRFARHWSCYTRVPTVAALTSRVGIPTILELHGLPETARERVLLATARRSRNLRRLVAVSGELARRLAGPNVHGPVLVAHDGARLGSAPRITLEEARRHFGLPQPVPLVGYAGSLKPDKGVDVLLEAIRSRAPLHAAVLGGMPAATLDRLRATYTGDRFHLLGHRPPRDVPTFLQACDVVAAPFVRAANREWTWMGRPRHSVIHDYMSPLKLFEALASGRPLVVSDVPVLREVIRPGDNCLAVAPGDVRALGAALDRVLDNPILARRLGEAALRDVAAYTWDARARRVLSETPDAR